MGAMRGCRFLVCLTGWLGLLSGCGSGETIIDGEPLVIETIPTDGEADVPVELGEITATFSESMRMEGWSWVTEAGRSAPEVTGFPHYKDELTAVLPVRLEPATGYVVWVNSPDNAALRKFESALGVTARAHRIRFTTAAAPR
jgi:Bacterial Ig-like domain